MAEERVQRRLAAIVAADVVGYSRLMEQDEAGTLTALKSRRKDVLEPAVARYQGRIFKVTGDGVLAEFGSAVNAMQCPVGMAIANAGLPQGRRIVLRIGVNLGDVMVEGSDLYGDGVNIAARLEGIAEPGGICISAKVHDEISRKLNLACHDLGEQHLKNIATPIRAFHVIRDIGEASAAEGLPLPMKPSIAVLPFSNMSDDPKQQYFSDGVTEDIITELSRFRSLFVVARNSSFQYRDKAVDVRYVVEGSVRKMINRVRITSQLIDAQTANHLWGERYDRNIEELFEVQDEVIRTIVATLVGRLEDAEIKGAVRKRTESLAAYDTLLRGIEYLRGYTAEDNKRGRELFEKAVSLDPEFAVAHAYLAISLLIEHRYDAAPEHIKSRALQAALTAVQLDPSDSRCHQFLAQAYRYRGEYDRALTHSERSIALNPNDANAITQMGYALAIIGRAEKGVGLIRQAMRLNPFHPAWYWNDLAIALYAARRYEEALNANRKGQMTYWPMARAAACLAQLGRLDEARQQAIEVLRLKPDFHLSAEKLAYKNPSDAEHVIEGMRKAGLPE
jgi:adenylate cyclase